MATIRQYFDTDFSHAVRMHVSFESGTLKIESIFLYDFSGYIMFFSCFIPGKKSLDFYLQLIRNLEYGKTEMLFDKKVTLPSAHQFPGVLTVENQPNAFNIKAQFFGDPGWVSMKDITASRRIFIYSESDLSDEEIIALKTTASAAGHELQFRSKKYMKERSKFEVPLAFISHDSRDKDEVARKIAINLQRMLCPVWYDEFSLKVGNNLRETIEKGLKECKKCILVLSPHFFSNSGWTRKEFDSIFTREIIEECGLILPVWFNVTKQEVYEYCPSLLNVKGVNWSLGEEEVSRQLYNEIMPAGNTLDY